MFLRDIMTRNLEEISPQVTLKEAAEKMKEMDIGALPVCENQKLLGIITDRDITVRAVAEGRDPKKTRVKDAMTPGVIFCTEDDDVQEAIKLMEQKQIRRLLVVDQKKHPVGIVSLGDVATRMHNEHLCSEALERISEPAVPHS